MGFLRRDYGAAGLFQLAHAGQLSGTQAVVALTVMTLFVPCVANFLMIVKEQGIEAGARHPGVRDGGGAVNGRGASLCLSGLRCPSFERGRRLASLAVGERGVVRPGASRQPGARRTADGARRDAGRARPAAAAVSRDSCSSATRRNWRSSRRSRAPSWWRTGVSGPAARRRPSASAFRWAWRRSSTPHAALAQVGTPRRGSSQVCRKIQTARKPSGQR